MFIEIVGKGRYLRDCFRISLSQMMFARQPRDLALLESVKKCDRPLPLFLNQGISPFYFKQLQNQSTSGLHNGKKPAQYLFEKPLDPANPESRPPQFHLVQSRVYPQKFADAG